MVVALVCILSFLLPAGVYGQGDAPVVEVDIRGVPSGGYIIAAPLSQDSLGFVDLSGRLVHRRGVGLHTNLQVHGTRRASVFTGNFGFFNYVLFDSALSPIDTIVVTPPFSTDSHEGVLWTDTTFMMLGIDFRPFDMSTVVEGGQKNASLMTTVIQERHLATDSVLFEWSAAGRIPVTDATPNIELRQRTIDYIHANSIARDTDGDLIISCRHLDEIIKIRRSDGSIVWRLGGVASKNKQFTFINDDHDGVQGFSHQHTAYRTARGTIMMFDNGNLKPVQRSRVVEYALDTVAMTATRVWSYTPEPLLYSASQGSIQELANGNIIVGYSSTNDQRVAEEIDRNGSIIMQVRTTSQRALQPYRVLKSTMSCTSIARELRLGDSVEYADADSTTGISIRVRSISMPTMCRAEKHHYTPHEWRSSDSMLCGVLSQRWTLRYDTTVAVRGSLHFDAAGYASPESLVMYHRSREGFGAFTALPTLYNADSRSLTLDTLLYGEYAVAYTSCPESVPVYPISGAVNVPSTVVLRWSEAPDAVTYDVQVSLQSDMTAPLLDVTTARRDTIVKGLPSGTPVYWRVRKRSGASVGQWSTVSMFTTEQTVSVKNDRNDILSDVHVAVRDGQLHVTGLRNQTARIDVYDLLGATLASARVEGTDISVEGFNAAQLPRVFLVVVVSAGGERYHQLMMRP